MMTIRWPLVTEDAVTCVLISLAPRPRPIMIRFVLSPSLMATRRCSRSAVKKVVKPSQRRPTVSYLHGLYRVSERRACRVARVAVSTFRYESRQEPRTALRLRIREIAQVRVRYGYRKIRVLLNREGWNVGKKLCIGCTGRKA
jgi:hypothetical protein